MPPFRAAVSVAAAAHGDGPSAGRTGRRSASTGPSTQLPEPLRRLSARIGACRSGRGSLLSFLFCSITWSRGLQIACILGRSPQDPVRRQRARHYLAKSDCRSRRRNAFPPLPGVTATMAIALVHADVGLDANWRLPKQSVLANLVLILFFNIVDLICARFPRSRPSPG
jgi:hypothetical protein